MAFDLLGQCLDCPSLCVANNMPVLLKRGTSVAMTQLPLYDGESRTCSSNSLAAA
jgi:hypothetical protein